MIIWRTLSAHLRVSDTVSSPVHWLSCWATAGPGHTTPVRSSSSDSVAVFSYKRTNRRWAHRPPAYQLFYISLNTFVWEDSKNSRFVQVEACCRSRRGKARFLSRRGRTSDWSSAETEGGTLGVEVGWWRADGDRRSQRLEMLSRWKGSKCLLCSLPTCWVNNSSRACEKMYRLPSLLYYCLTWPPPHRNKQNTHHWS